MASGCFSSALSSYCSALQGTLNNCSKHQKIQKNLISVGINGTPCVQHANCTACQSDSRCHWCDTPNGSSHHYPLFISIGYCFDATNGGLVCSNLQGKWNPSSCASSKYFFQIIFYLIFFSKRLKQIRP